MSDLLALVVEDNEMLATFFAETLQDAGYQAKTALDGQIAMETLEELTPAILLLDLNLPNVSGENLLKFIHSQPRLAQMRIFATSAEGTRVGYLHDQVDFTLAKPVSYVQLKALASRVRSEILGEE